MIKNYVLSFIIFYEVNIFVYLIINLYVFDFIIYSKFSFDNCLESYAQYN